MLGRSSPEAHCAEPPSARNGDEQAECGNGLTEREYLWDAYASHFRLAMKSNIVAEDDQGSKISANTRDGAGAFGSVEVYIYE